MISIGYDTLTDATDNLDRISIGFYGITTVLSSSGWQKYYAFTNNTVWNPISLSDNLFGWYAIPGTSNAWPSTPQTVVISALDWTQYVGIAVLTNLGIPNSDPVNIPNTVNKIVLNGRGSYAGILNNGLLSTTNGDDQLIGWSYGVGAVNGLGGSGGTGILNKQSAIINTRGGNDRITGATTGTGGIGLLNFGQIFTENGSDKVLGIASGNGTLYGICNKGGAINTGTGSDQISGTGNNAIGGIANIQGSILSGDGDDVILGQVTNDSGGFSVGIANSNGVINAGSGSDTISGTAMGLRSVGIANSNYGSIDGGIGSVTDVDTITGTATGDYCVGIGNQGGTINVKGGLTPSKIILTGVGNGNGSRGIDNGFLFGTQDPGTIATGYDKGNEVDVDIITGIAKGDFSIGIFNQGFYTDPYNSTNYVFATIKNMGDKMGQIIGTASGAYSIGILNNGLINMTNTASSDGVVIKGTSDGAESHGIVNGYALSTGSGKDVITGETKGGHFGILNFGRIDTGRGDDIVTSIGDFGNAGGDNSDGVFLGEGNDVFSGFGFGYSGYFDGGAGMDNLILPALNQGQSYFITKDSINSATIRRSFEYGSSQEMVINNFETFTATGSTNFSSLFNNFAGQPSSFSIFY